MTVYTLENDDTSLIALNDMLFYENEAKNTLVIIRYFDDEDLAKSYMDKINIVSETEADQMFTHYIADFRYNTNTGLKVLNKNVNNEWVELKRY